MGTGSWIIIKKMTRRFGTNKFHGKQLNQAIGQLIMSVSCISYQVADLFQYIFFPGVVDNLKFNVFACVDNRPDIIKLSQQNNLPGIDLVLLEIRIGKYNLFCFYMILA